MKYQYTAIDSKGKTIKGVIESSSRDALSSSLRSQGLKPLSIQEAKKSMFSKGGKVKQKDLVLFTRQLSTMISAGVPLTRGLSTLESQAESKAFKVVLSQISKDVESGQPLGDSFAKHPNVFSDIYVNMVRAGEAGGILDDILKRLAAQVEQDSAMKKKVKSAMAYPVVLTGITVIAFFALMFFVVPQIGDIIKDLGGPDAELPFYTQALLGFSDFLKSNAGLIVVGTLVAVFGFRAYIKTPSGRYNFDSAMLKIPIVKTIVSKLAIARFSRTFASLMSAGVGVLDALQVTGGAIGNKVIEKELLAAAKEIKNGKQLSDPLSKSKHFPPIVAQMLMVGEETGQIDTILIKVADFYEEDVTATMDSLSSIIEPIMIVLLGGMVGVIAISVLGPISSLTKNLSG